MRITDHFTERLFQRFGILMTEEQQKSLVSQIYQDVKTNPPDTPYLIYDCKINSTPFSAVYRVKKDVLVTCIPIGSRMGRKKFHEKIRPKLNGYVERKEWKKHKRRLRKEYVGIKLRMS